MTEKENAMVSKHSPAPANLDTALFDDIPELTDEFWQNAVRNPFYRPIKKQITLRLDADVIAWLRRQGKGYQTKANSLLREIMVKEVSRKAG